MIEEILFDSRHKFVYCDEVKRDCIVSELLGYTTIDGNMPVYIKDDGLLENNSLLDLNKYKLIIFHERYYDFLIALSVVDTLIKKYDKDFLNKKLKRMFDMYSSKSKMRILNIDDLRSVFEHDKKVYKDRYGKYLDTGKLDFVDDLMMGFIMLEIFLKNLKRAIGLKGCFSTLFDYNDLSIRSMNIINKHINSRCNGYLSINVLCGNKEWKTYYDSDGYIIQNIHDYIEIDNRNVKKLIRHN